MPSFNTTVAWAVPVKVEVLGAHLEAYINLQPIINTLRMCHRFGKGDNVAVTRLPVELLSEVEEYLVARERRKTRKAWNADFRCFQLKCQKRDHFSEPELNDMAYWHCENSEDEDEVDEIMWEHIEENFEERHRERCQGWCVRLGTPVSSSSGIFSEQADFFLQRFGLETWTTHVRVSAPSENSFSVSWDYPSPLHAQTTVAYLKLPQQHQKLAGSWQEDADEDECCTLYLHTGYTMRLAQPEALTEKEISRFKRAVEILGLKPWVHPSQRRGWDSGNKNDEGLPVNMKPNLTVLSRIATD
ncbi:hypothetical protein KC363_g8421 [Hortaea werneckii]|nr:hypothetical protein KC361_g5375 [Hortaea werneckii]KAI6883734.1 hypothetical protein KC325_g4849 [Hortaea werneckii]KAI6992697.1 hypothetical protein KC359_g5536 [Hortaea werneckii]KAI7145126.1 hypothetical protein KC344_g4775 [Hortaea werneckii]KAI7173527.1 hypothetical protein KC360_g4855 [Hortaea werneckii]